ncbi:MAG: methylglyoxal synthase [Clostridia bacterium]|nr:methylglyoxal synthase [Clostridia bacterium]
MHIAIIADDAKKELMAEFCIAYCGILCHHRLCATSATGKYIADATGLEIELLMSGEDGGSEQLISRVACDEVDIVFFFRAPEPEVYCRENGTTLLRLCDMHTVPIATNIATAEALVMALDRGDLSWRESR